MISGGDLGPPVTPCTSPRTFMRELFEQMSLVKHPTTERKVGPYWTAYSETFQLMDHRYYTLQALQLRADPTNPNPYKQVTATYVVKLFNDSGTEVGIADGYPCHKVGVQGTFQRSLDVLLMEQALEMATGQIIPVEK